jgi:acyl-coenzyme A synthetase/AMP-(fatty) acid ligase
VDVPTPGAGRVGRAFVVLSAGAEATDGDLLEFCGRRLAPHQVPAAVTFVDHLPRNSVGKLIRAELRTLAAGTAP